MSNFVNQSYDDRDTTYLKYEGNWFLGGSYNASNVGETGTLASTKDLNANVTFAFPVPAIAFYYYGIPRCCGGLYGICIDCDPQNPNYIPINAVNRSDDGKNPPIVLYSMQFKELGIHEIIIRNENDTSVIASGNSELTIDRIDLEVSSSDLSTTVITSVTSSILAGSGSLSPSSSALSTGSSSSPSQSHSPPIGAIVGGVLGGGFVLVLALLILFWFRLKQQRQNATSTENSDPSPFVTPPQQLTSSLHPLLLSSKSTTATPPTQNSITTTPSTSTQDPGTYGCAPRTGKGAPQSYSPSPLPLSSRSTSPPSSARALREQDAGPLPTELESPTLPPEYSQVFSHTIHSSNISPG